MNTFIGDTVTEWEGRRLRVQQIGSLVSDRFKTITFNMTQCDIVAQCHWADFPVGQHYLVAMNARCLKSVHIRI